MSINIVEAPQGLAAEEIPDEFELDMRVIEASVPLPVLACNTDDNCNPSCNSSCATAVADPF
ncbi:FxLD family lantipeptide [Nonomuraea thailandensis]|uniref:FxLD family lantipeptide n=1 Tax=Nonomuraea thailandensis TaxID=1188745 RepID=A0A9X2GKY5_9ACTN|nr:FxLD family lanthipeptide [Nonomuraea thailandensis]MCP2359705.1 FxLD family lantipeptide [Nonomuraea thailandensis]